MKYPLPQRKSSQAKLVFEGPFDGHRAVNKETTIDSDVEDNISTHTIYHFCKKCKHHLFQFNLFKIYLSHLFINLTLAILLTSLPDFFISWAFRNQAWKRNGMHERIFYDSWILSHALHKIHLLIYAEILIDVGDVIAFDDFLWIFRRRNIVFIHLQKLPYLFLLRETVHKWEIGKTHSQDSCCNIREQNKLLIMNWRNTDDLYSLFEFDIRRKIQNAKYV